MTLLDPDCLSRVDCARFAATRPFPWLSLSGCLRPEAFSCLCADFPPLGQFVHHQGLRSSNILRSHDRYYLRFDGGEGPAEAGVVRAADLAASWRELLTELQGPVYQGFVRRLFGVRRVRTRFAWHLGHRGSEVSPHLDAPKKVGTHLIYFNTRADWDPSWGGAPLILGQPHAGRSPPDFHDFDDHQAVPYLDNHSLMFRNGPAAWHGVERMTPPVGCYRRLFTVVFDYPRSTHLARTAMARLRARVQPRHRRS